MVDFILFKTIIKCLYNIFQNMRDLNDNQNKKLLVLIIHSPIIRYMLIHLKYMIFSPTV